MHLSGLDYGTDSLADTDMRAFVRGNSMMAPAVGGEEEERARVRAVSLEIRGPADEAQVDILVSLMYAPLSY